MTRKIFATHHKAWLMFKIISENVIETWNTYKDVVKLFIINDRKSSLEFMKNTDILKKVVP